jgi:hypothetical protein
MLTHLIERANEDSVLAGVVLAKKYTKGRFWLLMPLGGKRDEVLLKPEKRE